MKAIDVKPDDVEEWRNAVKFAQSETFKAFLDKKFDLSEKPKPSQEEIEKMARDYIFWFEYYFPVKKP